MIDPQQLSDTQLEQSLPALIWLGDLMPGGLFIYRANPPYELLYINRAALGIFGCDTLEQFKEMTGFTFRGLVHPEDYERIQDSIERQISETAEEKLDFVQYRITRRDGAVRWLSDFGRLVQLPEYGSVYVVFITDATERIRARERQKQTELALAHERQTNEIKSAFLFNMSHDIRTPMNAIVGFSELALRHLHEPEKLEGYLEKTVSSSRQLLRLIDDMQELEQLEGGPVELRSEATDLTEQIELVLDMFRIPAAEKQLTIEKEFSLPASPVLVDQGRFRRILSNLVSNAVKFTPPGGRVTVSARQAHVSASGFARYVFQVSDNGVGIGESFLPHVFDSFEREESSTVSGNTGTGLGLSIVKTLLNLMGGTVTVQSKKGEGSVFTVELPLRLSDHAAEECAVSPAAPADHSGNRARILIVEDIELNRMLAEELLELSGFLTESVEDGCDAVEAFRTHPAGYYDLILMDIQMPVMNGYEATRAIRALKREDAQKIPIIALSANSREEDRRRSMDSGMNNHVAKPFDIDYLTEIIYRTINREDAPDA